MSVRVGINGFGRIGRSVFRILAERPGFEVVAINDLYPNPMLAYLLSFDSVMGPFEHEVSADDDYLYVDGRRVAMTDEKDPAAIPWGELGADLVVESTGVFRSRAKLERHFQGGARKVVLTVPAEDEIDRMVVLGVNDGDLLPSDRIVSNASCTTNCLAPVAKVIHETFGIRKGWMTTVHSYTNDQQLLDLPHKDLRRARAAALSIIPTTTGAAVAVGEVMPEIKGRLDGISMRVPTPNVSCIDLAVLVDKKTSRDEVNAAFRDAAGSARYQRILEYTEAPLVSQDIVGNPHSCVFSALETMTNGNAVKVLGWYDNEWGYSNRLVDLCRFLDRAGL